MLWKSQNLLKYNLLDKYMDCRPYILIIILLITILWFVITFRHVYNLSKEGFTVSSDSVQKLLDLHKNKQLTVNNLEVNTITCPKTTAENLNGTNGNMTNIMTTNGTFDTLNSTNGDFSNIVVNVLTDKNPTPTQSTIANIKSPITTNVGEFNVNGALVATVARPDGKNWSFAFEDNGNIRQYLDGKLKWETGIKSGSNVDTTANNYLYSQIACSSYGTGYYGADPIALCTKPYIT